MKMNIKCSVKKIPNYHLIKGDTGDFYCCSGVADYYKDLDMPAVTSCALYGS